MKKLSILIVILSFAASCTSETRPDDNQFRSMIRLWHSHHLDDRLNSDLMEALEKYPDCCDEVWFEFNGFDDSDENVAKMEAAAGRMRETGITASMQVVAIGHPEASMPVGADPVTNKLGFRPVVSQEGLAASTQTCPRDTAFANAHARTYAKYAKAVQPKSRWSGMRRTISSICQDIIPFSANSLRSTRTRILAA